MSNGNLSRRRGLASELTQEELDYIADKANGDFYVILSEINKELKAQATALTSKADNTTTLQAMYNEVVEPSPEKWFLFDTETKSIVGLNTEYEEEYSVEGIDYMVFPFQINGTMVEQIGGFDVMAIGYYKIGLPSNVKNVRLPNCIKVINTSAFSGNVNLESVNIPTSCVNLKSQVFYGCSELKEVITPIKPNWELSIGGMCFCECSKLSNIDTIIDGVKIISQSAFQGCSIKNLTVPESVEEIQSSAIDETINCITFLNANCVISNSVFAYASTIKPVIKGYKGSTAETFANEKEIAFIALDEEFYSKDETESLLNTKLDFIEGVEAEIDKYYGVRDRDGNWKPQLYKIAAFDEFGLVDDYYLYALPTNSMVIQFPTPPPFTYQYKICAGGIYMRKGNTSRGWSEWNEYATTSDVESSCVEILNYVNSYTSMLQEEDDRIEASLMDVITSVGEARVNGDKETLQSANAYTDNAIQSAIDASWEAQV